MRIINLFLLPVLSGCIVVLGLHTLIPHPYISDLQLTQNSLNVTFGYLGFGFGFLPVFIRNYALSYMRAMYGRDRAQPAEFTTFQAPPAALPFFVGQTFTGPGANCHLRVKKLNINAILEYNNPLLLDYM